VGGVAGHGDGGVAGADDGLEGLPLVRGVALDGLDEVGDEVVAALELDVDLAEGVVGIDAPADQRVVHADENQQQDQENAAYGGRNYPSHS
jgi:hypothetical protein